MSSTQPRSALDPVAMTPVRRVRAGASPLRGEASPGRESTVRSAHRCRSSDPAGYLQHRQDGSPDRRRRFGSRRRQPHHHRGRHHRESRDGLGWPPAGGFIDFEYFDHRYRLKSGGDGWVLMRDSEPRAIAVLQQAPSGCSSCRRKGTASGTARLTPRRSKRSWTTTTSSSSNIDRIDTCLTPHPAGAAVAALLHAERPACGGYWSGDSTIVCPFGKTMPVFVSGL